MISAYQSLLEVITLSTVVSCIDEEIPFVMETDSSEYAISTTFSQAKNLWNFSISHFLGVKSITHLLRKSSTQSLKELENSDTS